MISTKSVKPALEQAYVKLMMDVIGRGLVMASQVDDEIKHEVSKFPVGFTLSMKVFPNGSAFIAKVNAKHNLELVQSLQDKPDLTITFKHLHHAFLVFSFCFVFDFSFFLQNNPYGKNQSCRRKTCYGLAR